MPVDATSIMTIRARRIPFLLLISILLVAGCATSGPGGSDGALVDQVRTRLVQEPRIRSTRLNITADNGEIVISGFVESLDEQRLLSDVLEEVRQMDGVTSVRDATTTVSSR